jgi:hypothetical protein
MNAEPVVKLSIGLSNPEWSQKFLNVAYPIGA